MRFFITLSYDGTRFHGWQVQPNGISVQGELQRALSLILRKDIQVTGAGRTDTGVHARMMVAHFDLPDATASSDGATLAIAKAYAQMPSLTDLAYKLNRLLPCDIAIQKIEHVSDNMHARFSATSRTYRYFVHTGKSPFLRHYSWQTHYALDFQLMNEAAPHRQAMNGISRLPPTVSSATWCAQSWAPLSTLAATASPSTISAG